MCKKECLYEKVVQFWVLPDREINNEYNVIIPLKIPDREKREWAQCNYSF